MGPGFLNLSLFESLSATTTESRDVGDRHSSIIRTGAWQSRDDFTAAFFREPADAGLSIDLVGKGPCTIGERRRREKRKEISDATIYPFQNNNHITSSSALLIVSQ